MCIYIYIEREREGERERENYILKPVPERNDVVKKRGSFSKGTMPL